MSSTFRRAVQKASMAQTLSADGTSASASPPLNEGQTVSQRARMPPHRLFGLALPPYERERNRVAAKALPLRLHRKPSVVDRSLANLDKGPTDGQAGGDLVAK